MDIGRRGHFSETMPEYSERALRKAQSSCDLSSSFRGVSVVRTMRVRCARSRLEWKRSALINALISGPDTWPSLTQLFAIIALRRDGQINKAYHDAGRAVLPMLPIFSACSDSRRRGEFIEHPLDASALGCASVCPLCAPIPVIQASPRACGKRTLLRFRSDGNRRDIPVVPNPNSDRQLFLASRHPSQSCLAILIGSARRPLRIRMSTDEPEPGEASQR